MNVRLLIAQYRQSYLGQLAPNIISAVSVDAIESGYDWDAEVDTHMARIGSKGAYENCAQIEVDVPDAACGPAEPFSRADDDVRGNVGADQSLVRLIVAGYNSGEESYVSVESVWDYYILDDNYEGFLEELSEIEARVYGESEGRYVRVVDFTIPSSIINHAIAPWKTIHTAVAQDCFIA